MATGKCVNIGKPCSKALKKYVIEADKTNFVCPECGGKLVPCDGPITDPDSLKKVGGSIPVNQPTSNNKLIPIIGSIVALATIGGGVVYYLTSSEKEPIPQLKIEYFNSEILIGTNDTLRVSLTPADMKATYIWSSNNEVVATVTDGIVKAVGEGEVTITVKVEGHEEISDSAKFYVKKTPKDAPKTPCKVNHNKIDLGFATYQGDIKNGKPEGNGIMTFKSPNIIPGSKGDIVAEPGECVVGTWRNGEVNLVTLHQRNGNKPIITHK